MARYFFANVQLAVRMINISKAVTLLFVLVNAFDYFKFGNTPYALLEHAVCRGNVQRQVFFQHHTQSCTLLALVL